MNTLLLLSILCPTGPEIDASFFSIYRQCEGESYFFLMARNWGMKNPVEHRTVSVGKLTVRQHGRADVPAQIGDCARRGKVDMHSLGMFAEFYTGGLRWMVSFEARAMFLGSVFMGCEE